MGTESCLKFVSVSVDFLCSDDAIESNTYAGMGNS